MKVKTVHFYKNGNVMVFDQSGEQIPELQGFILEVAEKLKEKCDKDTKFNFADWRIGSQECNFSWWFEKEGSS